MIKAIITDLDGTILPSGGEISPQTVRILEQAGQKGVVRIIATGRTLFAARKVLPDNFPIDYLIFSSGAGILQWPDKRLLHTQHIGTEEARKIARYLWDYNINFAIQREMPDNHHFYYTDMYPVHNDFSRRVSVFKEFGNPIGTAEEILSPVTQFLMILDNTHIRLLEQIRKELSAYTVIRTTSPYDYRAIWLEIFPKEVHKGHSCRLLAERLGILPEECAGIGNDYNDLDFLDICGESAVVGNAPETMRTRYKTVASDRAGGFTEFITGIFPEFI